MNKLAAVLIIAVVLGGVSSLATGQPLATVALSDNSDGWFTTQNLDAYGNDLDERLEPGHHVFTGHPAYVMGSDDARLVFDRPRIHYLAVTFRGVEPGDRQYRRLASVLSNGSVAYALDNQMTTNMLSWDGATQARESFEQNYCAVDDADAQAIYARTNATLYRYAEDCPTDRRPQVDA